MVRPYVCARRHYMPLRQIASINEVAELWHRSRSSVRHAIDHEYVAAEKVGGTWVITLVSVVEFWGLPPALLAVYDYANGLETALQITREEGKLEAKISDEKRPALQAPETVSGLREAVFIPKAGCEVLPVEAVKLPPDSLQQAAKARAPTTPGAMPQTQSTSAPDALGASEKSIQPLTEKN